MGRVTSNQMLGREAEFEAKYALKSRKDTGHLINHVSLKSNADSWGVFLIQRLIHSSSQNFISRYRKAVWWLE